MGKEWIWREGKGLGLWGKGKEGRKGTGMDSGSGGRRG